MPAPIDADDEAPEYDYPHLPGEELDPLMESTIHSAWGALLVQSAKHTLAGTDALITGNTPFVPSGSKYHTAPDLMVLPGMKGRVFGRYVVDEHGVPPVVCVEVVSPSNTWPRLERRYRRWLEAGVPEVYALHPVQQTVDCIVLIDGEVVHRNALGLRSDGMQMVFTLVGERLGLCCPGGRVVTLDDDPYGWLVQERLRADTERERAEQAEARAGELQAELDLLRGTP
jgi:Uma2 family endonuclease